MTSRHPAVSCACPKCQSERRTTPTPATEEREAVALEDCPIGLFISRYGSLCLKTEYGDNNGRIDAYIVSSGELFWGDPPQTVASQRASIVTPVDYAAEILAAEANERARALGQAAEHINRLEAALRGLLSTVERLDISEGVCCCGDDMATHAEPMSCGHTPVDAGHYHHGNAIQQARDANEHGAGK